MGLHSKYTVILRIFAIHLLIPVAQYIYLAHKYINNLTPHGAPKIVEFCQS